MRDDQIFHTAHSVFPAFSVKTPSSLQGVDSVRPLKNLLAADFVSCEMEPLWIKLVCSAHPTEACLNFDQGKSIDCKFPLAELKVSTNHCLFTLVCPVVMWVVGYTECGNVLCILTLLYIHFFRNLRYGCSVWIGKSSLPTCIKEPRPIMTLFLSWTTFDLRFTDMRHRHPLLIMLLWLVTGI